MLNKVLLTGYIGDKIFERPTKSGKRMLSFMLKQSYKYLRDGQYVEGEKYHKIISFDDGLNIGPGDFVFVDGSISTSKDKEGNFVMGITANNVDILVQDNRNRTTNSKQPNNYFNEELF